MFVQRRHWFAALWMMLAACEPEIVPEDASSDAAGDDAALPDAASTDASAQDGSLPNAHDAAPSDGSVVDAAVPDGASLDASEAGLDQLSQTSSGSRCFPEVRVYAHLLCPDEQCLPESTHVDAVLYADTLRCRGDSGCSWLTEADVSPESGNGHLREQIYEYTSPELRLGLIFDRTQLTSYTLENFSRALRNASVQPLLPVDGGQMPVWATWDPDGVEFVSYESGRLRFRFKGSVMNFTRVYEDTPHLCALHTLPTQICNTLRCSYASEGFAGAGEPARVTADITVPIEPLRN